MSIPARRREGKGVVKVTRMCSGGSGGGFSDDNGERLLAFTGGAALHHAVFFFGGDPSVRCRTPLKAPTPARHATVSNTSSLDRRIVASPVIFPSADHHLCSSLVRRWRSCDERTGMGVLSKVQMLPLRSTEDLKLKVRMPRTEVVKALLYQVHVVDPSRTSLKATSPSPPRATPPLHRLA